MKIVDEKSLQMLWSWGDVERNEFDYRFKAALLALLRMVQRSGASSEGMSEQRIAGLATELQEAGKVLEECAVNCMTLASTLKSEAGNATDEDRRVLERLEATVGSEVMLSRTHVDELQGVALVLDEIRGTNGVVRQGEDYWQTPLNRLLVLPRTGTTAEGEND